MDQAQIDAIFSDPTGRAYNVWQESDGQHVTDYGDWHRNYGRLILHVCGKAGGVVLDVGAGAGNLARALKESGYTVRAVERYPYHVGLGWKFNRLTHDELFVGDARDLSRIPDASIDLIHVSHVFEHIPVDRLEAVLLEVNRVAKPDSVMWAVHPTDTCPNPSSDPTHVTIMSAVWWVNLFAEAGWRVDPEMAQRFVDVPFGMGGDGGSWYREYVPRGEWTPFCMRRAAAEEKPDGEGYRVS